MFLRSQELYEPIPDREDRESLYESPLPHSALLLLFLCSTKNLLSSFLAEGRRLPLSHVNREATRRAAWRSWPGYRGPQTLHQPQQAEKPHRCLADSATRPPKHSPMGLRMRSQMGSPKHSPREFSSQRLRTQ